MRTLLACAVAAAIVALLPRPADACSCVVPGRVQLPAEGSVVPTNVRIWLGPARDYGSAIDRSAVVDDQGNVIPCTRTTLDIGDAEVAIFAPERELDPGTSYRLAIGDWELLHFSTGDGPDTTAPVVPRLRLEETSVEPELEESACGPKFLATYAVEHDGALLLLDVGKSAELDDVALAGSVSDIAGGDHVFVGRSLCNDSWPEAAAGARTSLRVAAVDQAGNFSGWSAPTTVELPPQPTSGCSTGGDGLALTGLAVAFASVLRRRPAR